MARYRLKGKHYLKIANIEWEQIEVDLSTGKQARKRYPVPAYLDPEDTSNCNYPGEIIVASKASTAYPRDYIFTGPPTLDMEPLDEEAEVEFAKTCARGEHPIESLPANGQTFSDSLLEKLTRQLDDISIRNGPPSQGSNDRVAALEAQIAELKELVLSSKAPATRPQVGAK
jgi:hypothetical protein